MVASVSFPSFQAISTWNPPRPHIPLILPDGQAFGKAGRRSRINRPAWVRSWLCRSISAMPAVPAQLPSMQKISSPPGNPRDRDGQQVLSGKFADQFHDAPLGLLAVQQASVVVDRVGPATLSVTPWVEALHLLGSGRRVVVLGAVRSRCLRPQATREGTFSRHTTHSISMWCRRSSGAPVREWRVARWGRSRNSETVNRGWFRRIARFSKTAVVSLVSR